LQLQLKFVALAMQALSADDVRNSAHRPPSPVVLISQPKSPVWHLSWSVKLWLLSHASQVGLATSMPYCDFTFFWSSAERKLKIEHWMLELKTHAVLAAFNS